MRNPTLLRLALAAALLAAAVVPGEARETQASIEVIRAADGYELPLWTWTPSGSPSAIIVALHGFRDHSGSFEQPAIEWQIGRAHV